MRKYKQLTTQERDQIAILLAKGISKRKIAKRIGRSVSTISDETKRNSNMGNYEAAHAHKACKQRKKYALKRSITPLKSQKIYEYVLDKLRNGWSPEQISGRIKQDYLNDKKMRISYETIYKFIYSPRGKELNLFEYLPRKQKKRKRKKGRKVHRSRIPDRVSIHDRPEIIDKREDFGHWEGDSVIGKGCKHGLHTEVERVTRFLEVAKVNAITATECINAQISIFLKHPKRARKSVTTDNGKENSKHKTLHLIEIKTYFADPYSSWQRGTNEYHNGLLRRYFPKGTDFRKVSDEDLQDVVFEINSRPRKCLDFKTPIEVYNDLVSVRITN